MDLNPIDYQVFGVLQELMYRQRDRGVDELRQCLIDCWTDMLQTIIDDAIDEWRAAHWACV